MHAIRPACRYAWHGVGRKGRKCRMWAGYVGAREPGAARLRPAMPLFRPRCVASGHSQPLFASAFKLHSCSAPHSFVFHRSLSGNQLNGTLPVAWSSMGRQLYLLDLSGNSLSGPLPAAWSRQRMLLRLGLARNNLTGPLPREWGRLRSLLQLDLAGNGLTGPLPAEWGGLRETSALDLSGNALTGALPPSWSGLGSLQMLSLAGNQLSGVSACCRAVMLWGIRGRHV